MQLVHVQVGGAHHHVDDHAAWHAVLHLLGDPYRCQVTICCVSAAKLILHIFKKNTLLHTINTHTYP